LTVQALEQNFIFATLGDEEKDILVNAMELMEVNGNFNVITQGQRALPLSLPSPDSVSSLFLGEEGDFFYVIEKGVFTVIVNDEAVASIGDGKSFGELALLYNTPRQATIRSQGVAQLFSLDRATFRYTLAKTSADRISNVQGALSKVPLLSGLTQLQLHKISQAVDIQKFEPGFPPSPLTPRPYLLLRSNHHREGL
jgi:cAMP-dependent protein kinase regulator